MRLILKSQARFGSVLPLIHVDVFGLDDRMLFPSAWVFFFSLTNDLVWLISDLITSILFNHLQLLLTVSQPMRIYEMHFFVSLETLSLTVKMIHKTLTVLCSVRPGGGVRRRLG